MSRKEFILAGVVVMLAGLYAVFFTDLFRAKVMRIEHSARSQRDAWSGSRRVDPTGKLDVGNVSFALQRSYKLTSVKVLPLAAYQTNKFTPPVWELVAKSGSASVDGFSYGMGIAGMTQSSRSLTPEPLEPGVEYRLVVTAGSLTGEHDFKLAGAARR